MRKLLTSITFLLTSTVSGLTLAADAPPIGIAPYTIDDSPYVFDTAEQHDIEVTLLAKGLPRAFSLAFLPDGDLLVSERGGDLRIIHDATGANPRLDPNPVPGMPALAEPYRNGGLNDLALHPDFDDNHWLYFSYNRAGPKDGDRQTSIPAIMRGRYNNGRLSNVEELFSGEPGGTSGMRIVFGNDGTLYMTTGAPFGPEAQELDNVFGKVLRLNDDGSIPADNPFLGRDDMHPAIYTSGHRDQLGLTVHRASGKVFSAEHGPNGGDEVNLLVPGADYGWPATSYGRNYDGSRISELPVERGTQQPAVVWIPSIGPSGIMFYDGDAFPAWKGNLFVGSVRYGQIDRTGSLERVVLNENFEELRREKLLTQLHQRIRDVKQGPDGNLYVLTDGDEFAVLRIAPK